MQYLPFIPIETNQLIVFGLFTTAIIGAWVRTYAAAIFFLLALMSAIFSQYVHLIAIPAIVALASGFVFLRQGSIGSKCLGAILVALLSIGFMLHKVPGFHNPFIIKDFVVSHGGIPYSLYLNFDKTLIGFLFLLLGTNAIQPKKEFIFSMKTCLVGVALIAICIIPASILMGYVRPDLKFGGFFFQWAWVNLFFTCLAEESFFRGFIQNELSNLLIPYRYGSFLALLIASLAFGAAHFAGGFQYVVLDSMAGLGYGLVYQRTKRIETSVLTHFSINAIHFLFFTYPVLSRSVA